MRLSGKGFSEKGWNVSFQHDSRRSNIFRERFEVSSDATQRVIIESRYQDVALTARLAVVMKLYGVV